MQRTYSKASIEELNPQRYKGEVGTVAMEGLTVGVKITDVRVRFGHLDLLVKPLNGSGERWVEQHRELVMM